MSGLQDTWVDCDGLGSTMRVYALGPAGGSWVALIEILVVSAAEDALVGPMLDSVRIDL